LGILQLRDADKVKALADDVHLAGACAVGECIDRHRVLVARLASSGCDGLGRGWRQGEKPSQEIALVLRTLNALELTLQLSSRSITERSESVREHYFPSHTP